MTRVLKTENLSLKIKDSKTEPKVLFVISKGVSKKAVDRNLLKRRAKAIVRDFKPKKTLTFFFKKGAKDLSYRSLKKEINTLLSEVKN
jgi:ribonuclease P protein component